MRHELEGLLPDIFPVLLLDLHNRLIHQLGKCLEELAGGSPLQHIRDTGLPACEDVSDCVPVQAIY